MRISVSIPSQQMRCYSVYAADVNGNGDIDVLSASCKGSERVVWYENDGNEGFTSHVIALGPDHEICYFSVTRSMLTAMAI